MQRAVAHAMVQDIEARTKAGLAPSLEELCRILLVADTFNVKVRLRGSRPQLFWLNL